MVLNLWATMIRDLMIGGASVEDTLTLWASLLREAKQRIRPLFTQDRVAISAGQFLDGLLGNEPRKTGWMRAEAAGDQGPWRQQAILGRGRWDADALRDIVREYALETLCDEDAILVIDETGFLKQGKASCGVARQYTGSAGKITNCQIGVFACYVSRHGHAFIDRALYLPKEWTDDRVRLKAAHVPRDVGFATKPKIARRMIAGAIAAKVPFSFVAADSVYGTGEIETLLRNACKGYVLGVASNHVFYSWGKEQPISPRQSRRAFPSRPGAACRPATAPKVRAGTTGPTLNWPISTNTMTTLPGNGREVFWSAATLPTAAWRFTPRGAPRARQSKSWCQWKAIGGPLRTASKRPRANLVLITTKPAPGMAGIAMSHSSCLPSPSWPSSALGPTPRPKKRDRDLDRSIVLDPLVDPGNPAHRNKACAATHLARTLARLVVLAQGSSSQRAQSPSQEKIATVMLGLLMREPAK
jgi:hypothetical protein